MFTIITEDDIPIHFIAGHLRGYLNLRANVFTNASPFGIYGITFVNKPVFLKRCIDKPEEDSTLRFSGHHTVSGILPHHFIYNIRVGIREIKSVKAFLLFRNAEFQFISVIEEE